MVNLKKTALLLLIVMGLSVCLIAAGQEVKEKKDGVQVASANDPKNSMAFAIKAFAAAFAIGICAMSTAYAQARIGAAGVGTMAEKPELSGRVMLLVAIPETLVILGFVIAALILL